MGYFPRTCVVSGLPVHVDPGDPGVPVVWWLLARNPTDDGTQIVTTTEQWFPVTWPIRARFEWPGSLVHDPDDPRLAVTLKVLSRFISEDWRDPYSPVSVGMDAETLLRAEHDGRLRISRVSQHDLAIDRLNDAWDDLAEMGIDHDDPPPRTIRGRIVAALRSHGLAVWPDDSDGMRLTEVRGGVWEISDSIQRITSRSTLVVIAMRAAGFQVRPRDPDRPVCTVEVPDAFGEDPLMLRLAIAREDAFRAVSAIPICDETGDAIPTLESTRDDLARSWNDDSVKRFGAFATGVDAVMPVDFISDLRETLTGTSVDDFLDDAAAFSRLCVVNVALRRQLRTSLRLFRNSGCPSSEK